MLFLLVFVIAVVGLAIALFTGTITTASLLNIAGLGPAQVEVTNLRDDTVSVVLQTTSSDGSTQTSDDDLKTFDIRSLTAGGPGHYHLTITTAAGQQVTDCSLNVTGGSKWDFVALPDTTLVSRNGQTPSSSDDLIASTSSLCR